VINRVGVFPTDVINRVGVYAHNQKLELEKQCADMLHTMHFSRQIAPRHMERELIGLVQTVRHWRLYLWGREFVVRIDHYSLKFLLDQRLSTIPQHQWASKLLGFDFTIEYKPSSSNVVADALSRRDSEADGSLLALSAPTFQVVDDLRQELDVDPALQKLLEEAQTGRRGDKWKVVDNLLTVAGRMYVPASLAHIQTLLAVAHNVGHEGTERTLHHLRGNFYILGARTVMREFVHAWAICQRNKVEHLHPAGLLQPLDLSSAVWEDVAMDFI
jgi:hypothetical protein